MATNWRNPWISGELVCAGRLGYFEARPDHPLLDTLEVADGVARSSRALSKRSDPWIRDHVEYIIVESHPRGENTFATIRAYIEPDFDIIPGVTHNPDVFFARRKQ